MQYATVLTILVGSSLVLGSVTLRQAHAGKSDPVSTEVVATITAINASSGLTTLQTKSGEVCVLTQETSWKVGSKVECQRVDEGPLAMLQQCQP